MRLQFDNAFARELPADPERSERRRQVSGALYSHVTPTPVAAPQRVAWSPEVAALLGLTASDVESPQFTDLFAGNALLPEMQPIAVNYGGHQFGSWAGQLGDGRAISLGETLNAQGQRWELQLKGAGPTPYSRSADGRAVLRSSVREFLCSEAMHHLGVPTTRALSLVVTGEQVVRDMFYDGNPEAEPGAVVCRVAPSFIRFGNFELPASRADLPLLNRLVDFTIRRDFPHLLTTLDDAAAAADTRPTSAAVRAAWFAEVCERTALMVAHWMRVGFVHGVMNTDNMSILGLTIDYGPYGWIDNYDPDWTPNTTDAQGRRYRFAQQASIAHWNLVRLAGALLPLFADEAPLQAGLQGFVDRYGWLHREHIAAKLGFSACREDDVAMFRSLQALMHAGDMDMTLFFRALSNIDATAPSPSLFSDVFYDEQKQRAVMSSLQAWLDQYCARLREDAFAPAQRRAAMNAANPLYVLRNYLAQQAIDRAYQGDYGGIAELLQVLRRPYEEQPGCERFAQRRPDWARQRAGCSMLSCSS